LHFADARQLPEAEGDALMPLHDIETTAGRYRQPASPEPRYITHSPRAENLRPHHADSGRNTTLPVVCR